MFVYRFRIKFEEQEGFSRDIELRSDQTFLDFHKIMSENLSFDISKECAFFLCDHKYRKKKQIHQHMPPDSGKTDITEDSSTSDIYMEKAVLSDFIDDPRQKFLYVYDMEKDWQFYIDLIRIKPASGSMEYPVVAASEGGIPVEIKPKTIPGDIETEMESEAGEFKNDDDETTGLRGKVQEVFGDEDADDFDDSAFYNDSVESGGDIDDEKQQS